MLQCFLPKNIRVEEDRELNLDRDTYEGDYILLSTVVSRSLDGKKADERNEGSKGLEDGLKTSQGLMTAKIL